MKWYTIAAERFRRAEWKKKAQEALVRLGAELPTAGSGQTLRRATKSILPRRTISLRRRATKRPRSSLRRVRFLKKPPPMEPRLTVKPAAIGGHRSWRRWIEKERRRGRRGGRGRCRKGAANVPGLPNQAFAETSAPVPVAQRPQVPQQEAHRNEAPRQQISERPAYTPPREATEMRRPAPARVETPMLQLPSERAAHGRAGDPALASRMTVLESTLRRLLSSPLHKLEQADEAPAGPGVFLLSDSDQVTSYYVEACQTLRIGLGNLARGGRTGKVTRGSSRGGSYGESGLKAKLAEHLGISEAKVSQYLKDHCVVRWIQLDDDAPLLAHFVIALLRTPLNLD